MVDVKIIDVDYDHKKISLSIRALLEAPAAEPEGEIGEDEVVASADGESVEIAPELEEAAIEEEVPAVEEAPAEPKAEVEPAEAEEPKAE